LVASAVIDPQLATSSTAKSTRIAPERTALAKHLSSEGCHTPAEGRENRGVTAPGRSWVLRARPGSRRASCPLQGNHRATVSGSGCRSVRADETERSEAGAPRATTGRTRGTASRSLPSASQAGDRRSTSEGISGRARKTSIPSRAERST
jgi:hypothetical protein